MFIVYTCVKLWSVDVTLPFYRMSSAEKRLNVLLMVCGSRTAWGESINPGFRPSLLVTWILQERCAGYSGESSGLGQKTQEKRLPTDKTLWQASLASPFVTYISPFNRSHERKFPVTPPPKSCICLRPAYGDAGRIMNVTRRNEDELSWYISLRATNLSSLLLVP